MIIENKNLLIEIGTEELPSDDLILYSKILIINLKRLLKKKLIKFDNIKNFITIRRISFLINIKHFDDNDIKEIIEKLLKQTTFTISMRWNNNNDAFIRPIIWYCLVHGSRLINHEIFNIKSGAYSLTHKIKTKSIKVDAYDYENTLKKYNVIVNYKERFSIINEQLLNLARKKKFKIIINKEILTNISNSVEYPKILVCKFKNKFLDLPEKLIINNLIEKNCIPLFKGNLISKFVVITDTYLKKIDKIKNGYNNCLNLKLSESEYFYNQKKGFLKNNKLRDLKRITFHEKIGSIYDKISRITYVIKNLDIKNKTEIIKSVILSKLDMQTKIVSEIPNMKALISAHEIKMNLKISEILYDYNKILNNDIPNLNISSLLIILDNFDSIVGFFLIGEKAKNKKDPFNLRRDVITIIKTSIKNKIKIDLFKVINIVLDSYKIKQKSKIKNELVYFFYDRLKFYSKNKFIKNIKNNDIYEKYLISNSYLKFKLYKFNSDLKYITKRIEKITAKNYIDLKKKYDRKIDKKYIKINLIIKFIKELKILRILNKNNLYFEYIKTILNMTKTINTFFNEIFILNADNEIKFNNLKILKILDKHLNALINFKHVE